MSIEQYSGNSGLVAAEWPQDQFAVRAQTPLQRLSEWAQTADVVYRVAQRLAVTSFVPAQFKGKPEEVAAAILAGMEVGLGEMASLRSFDIIQGVAAARALTLRAIVQSKGHEIVVVEQSQSRAVVKGRRQGASDWQTSTWDLDRARGLQLLNKDNWKKQPGAMLVARATSECCRLVAADAILGIPYSVEELQDGPVQVEQVFPAGQVPAAAERPAQPAQRTARRRTAPANRVPANTRPPTQEEAPAGGPPLPGDEPGQLDGQEELFPEPEKASREQLKKLFALCHEHKITEDSRHLRAGQILGHPVASFNDLTVAEASTLIDALETFGDDQ